MAGPAAVALGLGVLALGGALVVAKSREEPEKKRKPRFKGFTFLKPDTGVGIPAIAHVENAIRRLNKWPSKKNKVAAKLKIAERLPKSKRGLKLYILADQALDVGTPYYRVSNEKDYIAAEVLVRFVAGIYLVRALDPVKRKTDRNYLVRVLKQHTRRRSPEDPNGGWAYVLEPLQKRINKVGKTNYRGLAKLLGKQIHTFRDPAKMYEMPSDFPSDGELALESAGQIVEGALSVVT